ncbi:MAG TPA: D-glycerate dehydrogenase [Frankiaceae bacterium]|nr:D-glycerate dehydrogenase [Frankiaceae bacterium]
MRVVVTAPLNGLEPLAGHEVVGPDGWRDALPEADALLCLLTDRVDAGLLDAAPNLRAVGTVSVGYDHVDLAACAARGITVVNTPGVLTEATADVAFGLLLAAARLFRVAGETVTSGRWAGWQLGDFVGRDVHGATLGLVGYGRIARAVARRAEGFGMRVLHHSRSSGLPLDDLLAESGFVSLHVPLNSGTHHLVGARELALLGRGGVLVNTSRGPVVDETALAAALVARTIFAAGLDVYENEPEIHPALLASPFAVLLPHVGSATEGTRFAMNRLAASGVADVLAGRTPPNVVR